MTSQPFIPPTTTPLSGEDDVQDTETVGVADRDADVARSRGEDVDETTGGGVGLAGDTGLNQGDTGLLADGDDTARDSDGVPVGRDDARADAVRSGADPDEV